MHALYFIFTVHQKLALYAAFLFVVGLFLSWPVVHYRMRAAARLPLAVFGFVLRAVGPAPSIARLAGVIFGFNVVVIFSDMALGVHPVVPRLLCMWTGMNVGIIVGLGDEAGLTFPRAAAPGRWRPSRALASLCALVVVLLELPCFWLSIAMGMSLGYAVQSGASDYAGALALRAQAYATVIAPLLACSALAEAVAIRGPAPPPPEEAQ
jgi:hypothetical protein